MAEEKKLSKPKDPKRDAEIVKDLELYRKMELYEMMYDLKMFKIGKKTQKAKSAGQK